MISDTAKRGFASISTQCAKDSFRSMEGRTVSVKVQNDIKTVRQQQFVMLTISSYVFRVITFVHFTRSTELNEYVARMNHTPDQEQTLDAVYDYLQELGNEYCGHMKRELGSFFPNLGMSTPSILSVNTLKHSSYLESLYEDHVNVEMNEDGLTFGCSIMICAYGDVNFRVEKASHEDETDAGEFELF